MARPGHLPVHGSGVPGGGGHALRNRDKPLGPWSGQPVVSGRPGHPAACYLAMISPRSWWWPNRRARVPTASAARLLASLGAVLFGASALLVKAGTTSWDARLFRILNQVPSPAASALTSLSHLFLPAGIIAAAVLAIVYVVARNRSVLPAAAAAVAAGAAWVLAHVAKAIADRPRPYEVMADAVLRQQPAHGTSFPSSHTAVTVAVVIALVPFLARPLAAVAIGYAVLVGWSRVYLGVHYPLDVLAGAGIGMAAGGLTLLAVRTLLRRAGWAADGHNTAADAPGPQRRPPAQGEPGTAESAQQAGQPASRPPGRRSASRRLTPSLVSPTVTSMPLTNRSGRQAASRRDRSPRARMRHYVSPDGGADRPVTGIDLAQFVGVWLSGDAWEARNLWPSPVMRMILISDGLGEASPKGEPFCSA